MTARIQRILALLTLLPMLALGPGAFADSPGPPPPAFQWRTYTSADSRWALEVDPSRREGIGEASYVMRRDGEVVWSLTHPFTLDRAVVSDSGEVFGRARHAGWAAGNRSTGVQSLLWLLPNGAVVSELRWNTRGEESQGTSRSGSVVDVAGPTVDGLVVARRFQKLDRYWEVCDLDGKVVGMHVPELDARVPRGRAQILQARVVPDTGFFLVEWRVQSPAEVVPPTVGTAYQLIDPAGKRGCSWLHFLPDEMDRVKEARSWSAGREIYLASRGRPVTQLRFPGERVFEIELEGTNERHSFRVESPAEGSDEWQVVELERAPLRREDPAARYPRPPVVEIGEPISMTLLTDSTDGAPAPSWISAAGVAEDRVFVHDRTLETLFVYDGCLDRLAHYELPGVKLRPYLTGGIFDDGHGRILVEHDDGYVRLDPRSGRWTEAAVPRYPFWPTPRGMTVKSSGGIERIDYRGEVVWNRQRRPDRFWLSVRDLRHLPDGRLLALDGGDFDNDSRVPPALCYFSSEGTPLETVPLHAGFRARELWLGAAYALIVGYRGESLILRLEDRQVVQVDFGLPDVERSHRYAYRMCPGSDWILVLDREEGTAARFEVPDF